MTKVVMVVGLALLSGGAFASSDLMTYCENPNIQYDGVRIVVKDGSGAFNNNQEPKSYVSSDKKCAMTVAKLENSADGSTIVQITDVKLSKELGTDGSISRVRDFYPNGKLRSASVCLSGSCLTASVTTCHMADAIFKNNKYKAIKRDATDADSYRRYGEMLRTVGSYTWVGAQDYLQYSKQDVSRVNDALKLLKQNGNSTAPSLREISEQGDSLLRAAEHAPTDQEQNKLKLANAFIRLCHEAKDQFQPLTGSAGSFNKETTGDR